MAWQELLETLKPKCNEVENTHENKQHHTERRSHVRSHCGGSNPGTVSEDVRAAPGQYPCSVPSRAGSTYSTSARCHSSISGRQCSDCGRIRPIPRLCQRARPWRDGSALRQPCTLQ